MAPRAQPLPSSSVLGCPPPPSGFAESSVANPSGCAQISDAELLQQAADERFANLAPKLALLRRCGVLRPSFVLTEQEPLPRALLTCVQVLHMDTEEYREYASGAPGP